MTRDFGPSAIAVGEARRFASDVVSNWHLDPCDAAIIVSELAANAVLHGRSAFTVSLERRGQTVNIEVSDASGAEPAVADVPPDAAFGRGLLIVSRLSNAWGYRPLPDGGKTVWAEISAALVTQAGLVGQVGRCAAPISP